MTKEEEKEKKLFELEEKKVKALEKIANSLDVLTTWFEEIDKDEWSERLQFYLSEFHRKFVVNNGSDDEIKTEKMD